MKDKKVSKILRKKLGLKKSDATYCVLHSILTSTEAKRNGWARRAQ